MKTDRKKKSLSVAILEKLRLTAMNYADGSFQEDLLYKALGPYYHLLKPNHYKQGLKRLEKRGLIKIQPGPRIKVLITNKGTKFLKEYANKQIAIKKQSWDGLWRLITFDIPEEQRKKRASFRYLLKSLGLVQVQQSVWVCPYPCEKEIAAACELSGVIPYVSIFEGNFKGDEKELRKIFRV